ncbi:unnamed protein product, partial [Mesorhabditis belari]|uniref:Uncharacterized protein n=1 Tax=Mesorhabditis belari TaxID=2138241 RepID=A0AAF3F0D7_9BILA
MFHARIRKYKQNLVRPVQRSPIERQSRSFSNKIFDECYSPCRLPSLQLQWYEHSKFAFSLISLVVLVLLLVSAFFKSDVLKRSISARFFVIGGVLPAVIYMAIWMVSSAEFSFNDVTCSLEGTRLFPTASPLSFGVCSWLQKLMSTCSIVCNITPLLSISFSMANRLQTRFVVSLIRNIEVVEHFVWVALLAYGSSLPFVLTNSLGVERDEFSGVCLAGNLSTISMGTNFGVSIFFVLLVFGQTVIRTWASRRDSSNENVAFVELLEADKVKVNGAFLHKNLLYSNLSIVAILFCYALWIAAIGLHSIVVAGWPSREKETIFSDLKCLFNLSSDAQNDEASRLEDHRQDNSQHECSSSALGYRPTYSFLVFVVLPIIPFLFVAIIDALPSIWNSSFGMGMWARRKLQIMTTLTESNSQPTSKNRDTVESSRSCGSNSTQPVRRGNRTSRLYQAQREVATKPVSAPPTDRTLEEVQRLAQIFSMEVQGLAQERAELHELSRVQDQTLMSLAQQLDHANAELAALRGEEPPIPVLRGQIVEAEPQIRLATHDERALTRFQGFGTAQPVEAPLSARLPAPQAHFLPEMQPSTSNPFGSFQGFRPMQFSGQSTSQQPRELSDESDESVPSHEDVQTLDELRQRANGNLEEPRERIHDVQGPSGNRFQFNVPVLAPPPFPQLIPPPPPNRPDPYGVLYPMSSVMTVPEIQLRAQVLQQVLQTDPNIPVYPYQVAVVLERAGVLNRVDAQRPLRPNHVIYRPDRIEEMLGTTPNVPPNLRNPATFHEHIGRLAFQQGLTLAVIYRDAAGPPRNLPGILERINIAEIVPAELRELIRQGNLNAINEARQIIEQSEHAIRLNMEDRVLQAFLYVRDFLDSRATIAGLLPANQNPAENDNAQQPHDPDSANETS